VAIRASRIESVQAVFTLLAVGFVVLTLTGVFFRGRPCVWPGLGELADSRIPSWVIRVTSGVMRAAMKSERAAVETTGGASRRDYLKTAWKVLGLVAAAEFATVLVPSSGRVPRERGEQRTAVIEAGPVAEFTPASVTAFPKGRFYLVRLADGDSWRSPADAHIWAARCRGRENQDLPLPVSCVRVRHDGQRQQSAGPRAWTSIPYASRPGS